jgi:hypothetical protein
MPGSDALLAHIVSQTRQNVEFLMAHNELSRTDGAAILQRLPSVEDAAVRALSEQTHRLMIPEPSMPVATTMNSGPPARAVPPPAPRVQQAKAIWAYNENGTVRAVPHPSPHPFLPTVQQLTGHRRSQTTFPSAQAT